MSDMVLVHGFQFLIVDDLQDLNSHQLKLPLDRDNSGIFVNLRQHFLVPLRN